MAVTKIKSIHSTLKKAVQYIVNPHKTDNFFLVDSFGCVPQMAHQEFAMTASRGTGRGSVLAFHLIQSFKPGETDPETAHKIGQEFASLVTGDRYEYVVATHMDKDHIHNHICINHALMLYEGMKRYRPNMKTAISKVSQYDMKKPMHQFLKVHRFFNHIFSFYHLSFMYFSGSANKNKL